MEPSFLIHERALEHQRELLAAAARDRSGPARARRRRFFSGDPAPAAPAQPEGRILLRQATGADRPALSRLARLDGALPTQEPMLLAEVDGRLVAAVPLAGGAPIADPFLPTAEVVGLLALRAAQLNAAAAKPSARRAHGSRLAAAG